MVHILHVLPFLDYHKPDIIAIWETKIDSLVSTSELFPDSCPFNAYRKDRNLHGDGEMLLANKTSHYIASWYREPSVSCEDFQLLRNQLEYVKTQHKKLPLLRILGDFNFRDIVWPGRQQKWVHPKSVGGASTCG